MFSPLAAWIVRHRWWVLLAVLVATGAAARLAKQIEFDFTVEALFYGEREERNFSDRFNETFAHEDNLIVRASRQRRARGFAIDY